MKPLILVALALLAVSGVAFLWLQRDGRSSESTEGYSFERSEGSGLGMRGVPDSVTGIPSQRVHVGTGASNSLSAKRTTWSAQVVTREGRRPLEAVTLKITLLSPEASTEEIVLITGRDGAVGPIDIPFGRSHAAKVRVDPGPQSAGLSSIVLFTADRANHDVLVVDPPATLSVQVVELLRDVPLTGADVDIRDANGVVARATTDGRGLARFRWVAAGGPFSVNASAPGFSAVSCAELPHPPSSDQEVRLLLAPTGVLRVLVQDEAGLMVSPCKVEARLLGETLGTQPTAPDVRITAAHWEPPVAESGAYVFSSMPCETILVLRAASTDGREGNVFARVPAASGSGEATIVLSRGAGIGVWTFDDRGVPLGAVKIGAGQAELGTTDETGHTTVGLPESESVGEFWAYKPGYAVAWQQRVSQQTELTYRLVPETVTSGKVVDSSGRPQSFVRITPLLGAREEPRDLRRRRGEVPLPKDGDQTRGTDSSGAFMLIGLGDGWIDLDVRPPKSSPFEVRDVFVGTQGLVITIPDESTLGSKQGIGLSILVLDEASGAPLAGASVTAFHAPDSKDKSSKETRSGKTKANGQVRLAFAREGHYWIVASADGYVPFSGPIVDYPVGEHGIEIQLVHSAELKLVLVDRDGRGQEGFWVSARDVQGGEVLFEHLEGGTGTSRSEIMTAVQGHAHANRMPGGRLILEVRAEPGRKGAVLFQKEVELVPGERVQVELRMP